MGGRDEGRTNCFCQIMDVTTSCTYYDSVLMNLLKKSKEKNSHGKQKNYCKECGLSASAFMESKRIAVKNIVKVKK